MRRIKRYRYKERGEEKETELRRIKSLPHNFFLPVLLFHISIPLNLPVYDSLLLHLFLSLLFLSTSLSVSITRHLSRSLSLSYFLIASLPPLTLSTPFPFSLDCSLYFCLLFSLSLSHPLFVHFTLTITKGLECDFLRRGSD